MRPRPVPGSRELGGRDAVPCPYLGGAGQPAVRTPGGVQDPHRAVARQKENHNRSYVNGVYKGAAGCPPYVGSNPTPATTCENGPLAAETRPGGPFPSCVKGHSEMPGDGHGFCPLVAIRSAR